jgi:hypothetical protein
MSNASQPLIDKALEKLAGIEAEAAKVKAFINQICEFDGREPMFSEAELKAEPGQSRSFSIAPDQFFNKPFATAVREILTIRADTAGRSNPASIDEIHAVLVEGGFNFQTNDREKQKQGLAVSLGKNTVTFRKLPSGLFGLAEWYGGAKAQRRKVIVRGELVDAEVADAEDATQGPVEDPDEDEAEESLASEGSPASDPTPHSADEDGREVEHDNMTS